VRGRLLHFGSFDSAHKAGVAYCVLAALADKALPNNNLLPRLRARAALLNRVLHPTFYPRRKPKGHHLRHGERHQCDMAPAQ
jgi:hypothetical protein